MSNTIYRYYVYAYLRSIDSGSGAVGTPYYIGKGTGKRAFRRHKHIPVPKDKSRIIFLETNLSNVGACALERRYILWYGRKDIGTGILLNRTDGGDGTEGHRPSDKSLSEEHKRKISQSLLGKPKSEEHKRKLSKSLSGKHHSEETKRKMSLSQLGKSKPPRSEEHKRKLSKSLSGKHHSEESKRKMSASRLGKTRKPFSEEHKRKLSESQLRKSKKQSLLDQSWESCHFLS